MKLEQKYIDRWNSLGLNPALLENDPKGAKTLLKTRLIFPIVGFYNSGAQLGIKKHERTDKIQILKSGKYINAADLKMHWSQDLEQAVDKNDKPWLFLPDKGLLPIDQIHHDELLPVMKIENSRLREVIKQSERIDPNAEAVIQVVINPRNVLPEKANFFTRNFRRHLPLGQHAAIRVIDKEGNVYSTGFDFTGEEAKFQKNHNILGSLNGGLSILDFEEFRKHEGRITTSFAISSQKSDELITTMKQCYKKTIRYQVFKQNCNTLAVTLLNKAGIKDNGKPINIRTSFKRAIALSLPSFHKLPLIKNIAAISIKEYEMIKRLSPDWIKDIGRFSTNAVLFIPRKTLTMLTNILIMTLGSRRGTKVQDSFDRDELEVFDHLNFALFSEVNFQFDSPNKFANFLLRQKSTKVEGYKQPEINLCPQDDSKLHQRLNSVYGV